MTKFIRKYQKQVLAVFTVVLMISFAASSGYNKSGRTFNRRAIGHVGTEAVYNDEKLQAANDWQLLSHVLAQVPFLPNRYSYGLSLEPQPAPYVYMLGFDVAGSIENNPDIYFLLQQEAKQRGIQASGDEVGTVLANELYTSDYQKVTSDTFGGPDAYDKLGGAVARFLPVLTLIHQVEADVKVSKPMWDQSVGRTQLVRLAIVEMTADRFTASVGIPTPEQIQAQYDKYRDVLPRSHDDAADMNFGYKIPDRVRIQYLTIPRKPVLDTVRAGRPAYDWKVDAIFYYNAHKDEFVGLPPETQPAKKPATSPTTATAGATTATATAPTTGPTTATASTEPAAPTTRPFAEVQEKVMTTILAAPADELTQKIQSAITARLTADYTAYASTAGASAGPTTVPATGFPSKAYLDGVALDIQKQFNVLPEVTQTGDWLDTAALAKFPGIGGASTGTDSFANIAIPTTRPAAPGAAAPQPPLAILQFSEPMKDPNSNIYVFRVVQRDAAHTPPLKEIVAKVTGDVQAAHMYQAALDAAKTLLEGSRKHGLSATAGLQNLPVITTPTAFAPGSAIPGYNASPEELRTLGVKASDLLQAATSADLHPLAIVELPADKKVLVVQLIDIAARFKSDDMYFIQLVRTRQQDAAQRENIARQYFSYDALKSRLNYVPISSDKSGS